MNKYIGNRIAALVMLHDLCIYELKISNKSFCNFIIDCTIYLQSMGV